MARSGLRRSAAAWSTAGARTSRPSGASRAMTRAMSGSPSGGCAGEQAVQRARRRRARRARRRRAARAGRSGSIDRPRDVAAAPARAAPCRARPRRAPSAARGRARRCSRLCSCRSPCARPASCAKARPCSAWQTSRPARRGRACGAARHSLERDGRRAVDRRRTASARARRPRPPRRGCGCVEPRAVRCASASQCVERRGVGRRDARQAEQHLVPVARIVGQPQHVRWLLAEQIGAARSGRSARTAGGRAKQGGWRRADDMGGCASPVDWSGWRGHAMRRSGRRIRGLFSLAPRGACRISRSRSPRRRR